MYALSPEAIQQLFFWSNVLYVLGALLTVCSALLVIRAKRQPEASGWWTRLDSRVMIAPAAVCLLGTIAAVSFSGFLLSSERNTLDSYRLQVALELSRLRYNAEADRLASRTAPVLQAASSPVGLDGTAAGSGSAASNTGGNSTRELDLGPGAGESLRGFEGMRAEVEAVSSDAEAAQFADRLLLLLIANGIDARQGTDSSVLHQLTGQPGIHVRYKDNDGGHDFAGALARLLRERGLRVDVAPSWELAAKLDSTLNKRGQGARKTGQVTISVGPRPN